MFDAWMSDVCNLTIVVVTWRSLPTLSLGASGELQAALQLTQKRGMEKCKELIVLKFDSAESSADCVGSPLLTVS